MSKKQKETIEDVKVVEVKEKIVNENKSNLIPTIIMGLVGIILALLPKESNKLIGYIVGSAILVAGLYFIIRYVTSKVKLSTFTFLRGVFHTILGILILIYPLTIMKFISLVLGVYLIVNGALKMHSGYLCHLIDNKKWISLLISGIVVIIFGLIIIMNQGVAITRVAGLFLAINAIYDLISNFIFK